MSTPGPLSSGVKAAVTGGLSLPGLFGAISERAKQAALAGNSSAIAERLLAPDAATQLGQLAARGQESPLLALFGRAALQAPAELRAR